ncbi:MAG: ribosome small subunit-dependent GTPase A [Tenericutes bacterium GWC2_34_14]|nr:MAG: ribosome small subunit-dependent GTPase A [Tenericutes bacterium GWA2_35_7]OHE29900.1 MAG: ribosome small subunit-dependent GTPase A [Tenericutes bacterium GWC2_34_14]OHE34879.1 MAG: ribosome small subunit-dependent GTPase A [Tenericutes bacterium GWE2_34_108]OHE37261.1 MAG: ribosome small subunit-dependent GTPase A [Tenericutes bacterium GWF1_35_14]OHE39607.1 MAG: ribosome small subunit-dependent GTPase A [Tenericutes bacterium GWF2_35_184]OHE44205.1 MAG: ribosome small subunit-depend
MNQNTQNLFGFHEQALLTAQKYPNLTLGRITEHHKDRYIMMTSDKEMDAKVSGKWMYEVRDPSLYPTVGDFVLADTTHETAIIHELITRTSVLERKTAGLTSDGQLIAANIDYIIICQSMNENFNVRRLERYLSMAWSSGAMPVILLTKNDLTTQPDTFFNNASSVAIGVDIITCTDQHASGYQELEAYLKPGKTYVFIGSSGVGKSTVINHLLSEQKMETSEVGLNAKGRHTTTSRALFITSKGSIIIDTPGMREIQLDHADFESTFQDIQELSSSCKFNDCTHAKEPGCAVQKAIHDGILPIDRLHNYQKMLKELKYATERQAYLERQRNKSLSKLKVR